jgi:hypothetical protein
MTHESLHHHHRHHAVILLFVASKETDAASSVKSILEVQTEFPWQHHTSPDTLANNTMIVMTYQLIFLVWGFNKNAQFENRYNLLIIV